MPEGRAQAKFTALDLPRSRASTSWIDILLLVFLAEHPYINTLHNLFVYDDATQVVNNPYLQSFHRLKEIFTTPVWSFLGGNYPHNYYRPMMSFGYLLCYQLFGPVPWGFHLVNVLLNVAVVILLYLVTLRLFKDRLVAVVAAGVFAVHPIHSESVAWIAAITDIELALFYLLTLWFFLGLSTLHGRRLILGQLGMAASFVLALLSKEPAVTLVPLATLYEHFCRDDRQQTTLQTKLARYGPLWLLLLAYLVVRGEFVGALASRSQFPSGAPDALIFTGLALAGQYIWKLFWPAKLCAFYVFHMSTRFSDPRVIEGVVALVVLAILIAFFWNRARWVSFAVIFFLLNLAPVLNADWMAANVFTERYLYLPSVGLCWVLGWVGATLWRSASSRNIMWRGVIAVCVIPVAATCMFRIIRRNRDWYDDETLYKATLAVQPGAYIFHLNLAAVYLNRDDLKNAEHELQEAVKVAPEYPLILNNLGLLELKLKRYDEALGYLIRSITRDPKQSQPHLYLAQVYEQTGQADYAEKEYLTAIDLSPLSINARAGLAEFYFDHGRLQEAEKQFLESFRAAKSLRGYWGLGLVYWREGRTAEAERAFQQAVALDPSSGRAHIMLGLLYREANRNREALRELQAGLKSEPNNPQALAALKKLQSQDSSDADSRSPGPGR